jgi:hypothetical protein
MSKEPLELQTIGNRLAISGRLTTKDFRRVLTKMDHLRVAQGYQNLRLDFSECTNAYGGPILAIAAQAKRYVIDGAEVELILPKDENLRRLFPNANWATLIDPHRYDPGNYRGYVQIPAIQFCTGQDQHEAVNLVTEKMLSVLSAFDRAHLKALEWSLNEITDNVINHAHLADRRFVANHKFCSEPKSCRVLCVRCRDRDSSLITEWASRNPHGSRSSG